MFPKNVILEFIRSFGFVIAVGTGKTSFVPALVFEVSLEGIFRFIALATRRTDIRDTYKKQL